MTERATARPDPYGNLPLIEESAFVDPTAVVIGNVSIGRNVFVGPGAVIRADEPGSSIEIGEDSNVQDRVVVHALGGSSVAVGKGVSLAHACIIHGPCEIGAGCFIGFGSVVFNAVLGEGVVVKHLAVVEGVEIRPGAVVVSASCVDTQEKAARLEAAGSEEMEFSRRVVDTNRMLAEGYGKPARGEAETRKGSGLES